MEGKDYLEDVNADGKIILIWILKVNNKYTTSEGFCTAAGTKH
jgi:hypothetical protein